MVRINTTILLSYFGALAIAGGVGCNNANEPRAPRATNQDSGVQNRPHSTTDSGTPPLENMVEDSTDNSGGTDPAKLTGISPTGWPEPTTEMLAKYPKIRSFFAEVTTYNVGGATVSFTPDGTHTIEDIPDGREVYLVAKSGWGLIYVDKPKGGSIDDARAFIGNTEITEWINAKNLRGLPHGYSATFDALAGNEKMIFTPKDPSLRLFEGPNGPTAQFIGIDHTPFSEDVPPYVTGKIFFASQEDPMFDEFDTAGLITPYEHKGDKFVNQPRNDWGEDYVPKIGHGQVVVRELDGQYLVEGLREAELGRSAQLYRQEGSDLVVLMHADISADDREKASSLLIGKLDEEGRANLFEAQINNFDRTRRGAITLGFNLAGYKGTIHQSDRWGAHKVDWISWSHEAVQSTLTREVYNTSE